MLDDVRGEAHSFQVVLSDGSQEARIEAISEVQTLVLIDGSATGDDAGGAPA